MSLNRLNDSNVIFTYSTEDNDNSLATGIQCHDVVLDLPSYIYQKPR
jgi:hypothetical protein